MHSRFQSRTGQKVAAAIAASLLVAQCVLLCWNGASHSPTINEIGHIPAGISHWQYGVFHIYRVNPPLPRMVATIPILLRGVKTDWTNYDLNPLARNEVSLGIKFANVNGSDTFRVFTISRWACARRPGRSNGHHSDMAVLEMCSATNMVPSSICRPTIGFG